MKPDGMAHYKLILAYDGTQYAGFQRQKGHNTVQLELETALKKLGWQGKGLLAAGRTDAGVHASAQVVSFDLDWGHGNEVLLRALNAHLPFSIAAKSVSTMDPSFHPRYDAVDRTYIYRIYCQPVRDPLQSRFAWQLWPQPELGLMNAAGSQLVGEHDFKAFGSPMKAGGKTIREVFHVGWKEREGGCTFTICANAFLFHMVRRIVYILIQVGYRNQPVEIIRRGLETGDIGIVALAPACGLTLTGIRYKEEIS